MKRMLYRAVRSLGKSVFGNDWQSPSRPRIDDLTDADREILQKITGFSMTSLERKAAVISAVRHLVRGGIRGCIVECGVWRGGSCMAVALTLLQELTHDRDLYLFDTFEGMTPPTDLDRTSNGKLAKQHLDEDKKRKGWTWAIAGLDDVRQNMASTGYPAERVNYIKGPVEETIPIQSPPEPIALLRLDTDWYASTRHELIHLFPLLAPGGILIIDDYGHWAGARKAVDEFLAEQPHQYYLHRIDYSGRLLVKR